MSRGVWACVGGVLLLAALLKVHDSTDVLRAIGHALEPLVRVDEPILAAVALLLIPAQTSNPGPALRWPIRGDVRPAVREVRTHGFTVLELMVVVALIVTLTALLIPSLALARQQGRVIRSLATQRQILAAVLAYCENHREYFPHFRPLGDSTGPALVLGTPTYLSYFMAHQSLWAALVAPHDEAFIQMISPYSLDERRQDVGSDEQRRIVLAYATYYALSPTLSADPAVFTAPISEQPSFSGPGLLRGVRLWEIAHPSRKGLVLDFAINPRPWRTPNCAGFADGSAAVFDADHPPVPPIFVHGASIYPFPVLSTRHGVRGVDR